jgi:hypothetical protein
MTARSGFAAEPCPAWLEKCELCAVPVASRHGHLVDTGRRGLLCSCRACFLLSVGAGRYRPVPERYLWDPDRPLAEIDWAALASPPVSRSSSAAGRASRSVTRGRPVL